MKERIYTVATTDGKARLVQASSRAQALNHVARSQYTVEAANAITVGQLMSKGTQLETANEAEAETE